MGTRTHTKQTAVPGSLAQNRYDASQTQLQAQAKQLAEQVADRISSPDAEVEVTATAPAALPFGMTLAPVHIGTPSEVVDLAEYDPHYRGWQIVLDMDVTLATYNRMRNFMAAASNRENMAPEEALGLFDAIRDFIAEVVMAWNFPDKTGKPLPQPRDGGAQFCPMQAALIIPRAFGRVVKPPKA